MRELEGIYKIIYPNGDISNIVRKAIESSDKVLLKQFEKLVTITSKVEM